MLVDPEVLRAFAGRVDAASTAINAADVGHKISAAGDGLTGSTTQWAVRSVGEHFAASATRLAENVARMGKAVRGAGDCFEVADDALAAQFNGIF
jgi:uncharacterized protein YukE